MWASLRVLTPIALMQSGSRQQEFGADTLNSRQEAGNAHDSIRELHVLLLRCRPRHSMEIMPCKSFIDRIKLKRVELSALFERKAGERESSRARF